MAKKMLEYGANVDGNNGTGLPLLVASGKEHVSMVQLLLTNGANPNAQEESKADLRELAYNMLLKQRTDPNLEFTSSELILVTQDT